MSDISVKVSCESAEEAASESEGYGGRTIMQSRTTLEMLADEENIER